MDERLDSIIAALDVIALALERIASQLDPDALEERKEAMFLQLAHDLSVDPAEDSPETS